MYVHIYKVNNKKNLNYLAFKYDAIELCQNVVHNSGCAQDDLEPYIDEHLNFISYVFILIHISRTYN